jgi:hypothetical protein
MPEVITSLAEDRKFRFEVKRSSFALSLQRLCKPGSDLQGSYWVRTVECLGFDYLELQHLYRTAGFLHDIRHDLVRELYLRDLNLFNQ